MAVSGVTEYTNTYAAGRTNGSSGRRRRAQEHLGGLKEKYPGVNITVADFGNGKQEDAYLFGCSGGNQVVVSADILEKMAKDPAVAAEYEKVIAKVPDSTEEMKSRIAALGGENLACGVAIDKNGKVSYWSVSRYHRDRKQETDYKKTLQEQLEEKRAKKKEEEALKGRRLAKEESVERLLEKLRAEAPVKAQEEGKGTRLDLNI